MMNEEVSPGRSDSSLARKFILGGSVISETLKSFLQPVILQPFGGA